jgi:hypothetical protein
MQPNKPQQASRPRLETQIHRRKKAKAFSPLLPEWERTDEDAPTHLRMNSALMAPQSSQPNKKK